MTREPGVSLQRLLRRAKSNPETEVPLTWNCEKAFSSRAPVEMARHPV